jgi:monoamine oxidase
MSHSAMMRSLIRILQSARRSNLMATGAAAPITQMQLKAGRRNFLKQSAAMAASALVTGSLARAAFASGDRSPAIAVIGAGLAGLNAAYQLRKAGVFADLYEANTRVGGRVYSRADLVAADLVLEMGAEFINTDHDDLLTLVDEFGLSLFDRRTDVANLNVPASAYFFNGKAWSEAELAQLLRPLVAQISHDADLLDQDWDRYAPKFDQYSVSQYLDHYADLIPQGFVRTLFENTIRTEYGVEASESSALQLLFLLPTVEGEAVELLGYSDETYTVMGGNAQIAEGIARSLSGQIQFGMELTKIEKDNRDGFELQFRNGAQVYADHVILAMPFSTLRHIRINVPLPARLREFINTLDLGRNEKIQAGFSRRLWRQQGFALEAWTDLGFSEAWDGSQRQPDRDDGVLTYFLGGKEVTQADAVVGGPSGVGAGFTQGLAQLVPGLDTQATGNYAGSNWSRNPYSHGAYANFKPGQLTRFAKYFWVESDSASESQSVNIGRLIFAGEQLSDEYYGFMNGAAQTGRLAAQFVLQQLLHERVSDSTIPRLPQRRV